VKFKLRRLEKLSGEKASFYSIISDSGDLFSNFVSEYEDIYPNELLNILGRIKNMATKNGATDNFFKLEESSDRRDEKVVAFYDVPGKNLRLYCIKMSDNLIVLGTGGPKSKGIIRWQHDKKLRREIAKVMTVSKLIDIRIKHSKLTISPNHLFFEGNLELN
jgi:hypothetical protein